MQLARSDDFTRPVYFFIASEVRSGSTYVAELISYSLNASLGYDVWDLAQELLRDLDDRSTAEDIKEKVSSLWLSNQNIRSSKVMCAQLSIMNRCARKDAALNELLFGPEARWIVVRRRNKIRQAVSLAVARATGVFHSYDRDAGANRIDVSMKSVEDALRAVILSDEYLGLFSSVPAVCAEVFYEDVLEDPLTCMSDALGKIGLISHAKALALEPAKLVPDRQAQKADLEAAFEHWLLENHHPVDDRT